MQLVTTQKMLTWNPTQCKLKPEITLFLQRDEHYRHSRLNPCQTRPKRVRRRTLMHKHAFEKSKDEEAHLNTSPGRLGLLYYTIMSYFCGKRRRSLGIAAHTVSHSGNFSIYSSKNRPKKLSYYGQICSY
jgi:hypothetical protein